MNNVEQLKKTASLVRKDGITFEAGKALRKLASEAKVIAMISLVKKVTS